MNTVKYQEPKPQNDPLVRAIRKARRESAFGQLEKLLKEEGRWKRKVTIATSKLKEARDQITQFAVQLARESEHPGDVMRRAYDARRKQPLADESPENGGGKDGPLPMFSTRKCGL